MDQHRKGESIRQPGIPGDARLLSEIGRKTTLPSKGMQIQHTHGGVHVSPTRRTRASKSKKIGPFFSVFREGTKWKLLGGTITGGDSNETIESITIGDVGDLPEDGTFHWLKVNYNAATEDGVLLPGGEVTSVDEPGSGTSLPSNSTPTASNTSGYLYISLGEWMGGVFTPSNCGNIEVSHCPGSLTSKRV